MFQFIILLLGVTSVVSVEVKTSAMVNSLSSIPIAVNAKPVPITGDAKPVPITGDAKPIPFAKMSKSVLIADMAKSAPIAFRASNNYTNEIDQAEATLVYPPKRSEKFMPPCCGLKVKPCTDSKYRRLDGSCNNLLHPEWGVPNSTYHRLLPPAYGNRISSPRVGSKGDPLPPARLVRTSLFLTGQVENTLWPVLTMQFGQFVAHDMSLLKEREGPFKCCSHNKKFQKKCGRFCFPIKVPADDATMGKAGITCLNFTRTVTDRDLGCSKGKVPAQQINVVSSYLDLSNLYGLSDEMSKGLRSMQGGQLKVEIRNKRTFPPQETNIKTNCPCNLQNETTCYKTGDSRANQNLQLAILQILFLREHNRLATELAKINTHWDDEKIFQEARRLLIAAYQHITYYEWLPIFFGHDNLVNNGITFNNPGFVNDYNSSLNPAISQEHAHSAFRYFHTHIVGILRMLNKNRETQSTIPINNWFNRPQALEIGTNIEQLTMGLVTQNQEETDDFFVEEITDKMFTCPGMNFGIDLRATDFQRDRDHALAYYNDYRKMCGIKEATSFDDYADLIEPKNIEILKTLYKNFKDVDLSVGGSLEALVPGSQAGPTFMCIMDEQFRRSRQADRLFFENSESGFTQAQLDEIRKGTISKIFCDNGDGLKDIQPRGFILIFPGFNDVMDCSNLPSMDLTAWKDN